MVFFTVIIALLLAGIGAVHAENELDIGFAPGDCQSIRFDHARYSVCSFDPGQHDIRIYHSSEAGRIYGSFTALESDLSIHGTELLFAMNGGMYHRNRDPVGLYVESGQQLSDINRNEGPGNFHLMPNGVFYMLDGQGGVLETEVYINARISPNFATQSGPMLVIDGALHPRFLVDGTSKNIRNGVGVRDDGVVMFVLSEERVNFHSFGRVFRDRLHIRNALYLDGSVSRMFHAASARHDYGRRMGPIVGVTPKPAP
ncbi:MAG: hypothetical protein COA52_20530 [Hyphomicrobiales bacterium]|nr:MAG: hypothetical protein COA52_20530 [Hyphomicrobiales bacterium]